jgi:hypothetical protein
VRMRTAGAVSAYPSELSRSKMRRHFDVGWALSVGRASSEVVMMRSPGRPITAMSRYASYTFFTSLVAHLMASLGGVPWTALANMSTMMYFDHTSAALRLAGPS